MIAQCTEPCPIAAEALIAGFYLGAVLGWLIARLVSVLERKSDFQRKDK